MLAFLNLLFFGGILAVGVVMRVLFPPPLYPSWYSMFLGSPPKDAAAMVLSILATNLLITALVFTTLPGIAFFPLSAGFLAYRAVLWGLVVWATPATLLIKTLPVILLEGEGYVLAALAGTIFGLSWFKPKWLNLGKISRTEAFVVEGTNEFLSLYVFVVLLLFVSAIVEAAITLYVP